MVGHPGDDVAEFVQRLISVRDQAEQVIGAAAQAAEMSGTVREDVGDMKDERVNVGLEADLEA